MLFGNFYTHFTTMESSILDTKNRPLPARNAMHNVAGGNAYFFIVYFEKMISIPYLRRRFS